MANVKVTNWVELIGGDETVAQNKFGGSVVVPDLQPVGQSLRIIKALLLHTWDADATGTNLTPAGNIIIFERDPSIAVGTAQDGLTNGIARTILSTIAVTAASWKTRGTEVAVASLDTLSFLYVPLPALRDIYVAFEYTGATSFNSAAGDEETLEVKFLYE